MSQSKTPTSQPAPQNFVPTLRLSLEGDLATFGRVPASDVAHLLLAVERAVARAASVVLGRPSRKPGAREQVVKRAAQLALWAIEPGSIVPVLQLPSTTPEEAPRQQTVMDLPVAHTSELAIEHLLDVVTGNLDGHPYVVEALAQMARVMSVGDRYAAIGIDLESGNHQHRTAMIDSPVRRRLTERMKADKAAAREGMLVGTLVEADFEAFTARLRSVEGRAVIVSFDPSLADDIHRALREPAEVEGWVTYDPASQQARAINLRTVRRADQRVPGVDRFAFLRQKTFRQLQAEQGVTGLVKAADLHDRLSDEEDLDVYAATLAQLRQV